MANYEKLYEKINEIIGDLTPLKADCGVLCGHACCKGDENTGMRLFPGEISNLKVKETEDGTLLAVCEGKCNRNERPLSCKIFPFFPCVDEDKEVYVELDMRAKRLCPLVEHADEIRFDPRFLRAVERVGKILVKDEKCFEFLMKNTEEIDMFGALLG